MGYLNGACFVPVGLVSGFTLAFVIEQVFEVKRFFYGLLHRVEVFPAVHINHGYSEQKVRTM